MTATEARHHEPTQCLRRSVQISIAAIESPSLMQSRPSKTGSRCGVLTVTMFEEFCAVDDWSALSRAVPTEQDDADVVTSCDVDLSALSGVVTTKQDMLKRRCANSQRKLNDEIKASKERDLVWLLSL